MPENKLMNNGYIRSNENGANFRNEPETHSPLLERNDDREAPVASKTLNEVRVMPAMSDRIPPSDPSRDSRNKTSLLVQFSGRNGASTNIPLTTSLQRSNAYETSTQNNCLLLKEPTIRRQLIILAVVFIVLGAAIGALSVYFATNHHLCRIDHHKTKQSNYNELSAGTSVCLTEECVKTAASLLSAMDITADPCENFFQYACGTWNKMHIIPEDKSSISPFEVLADQLLVILKGVLEEPLNTEDNEATSKAKLFYKSCMDIPQIRKIGIDRLLVVINSLGGWPVIEKNWKPPPEVSLEELIGILRGVYNEAVLVEVFIGADDKNSSVNVLQIDEIPLVMPARDYYLKKSSENDLKAYHRYMTQMAIMLGADPETASKELDQVLQFEIRLVNATLPEAERIDPSANYEKLSLIQLQQLVPQLNWTIFFQTVLGKDIQLLDDEQIVSFSTAYFIELGKALEITDQRVIHNYIICRLVISITSYLIDDFQRENFEFTKIIQGLQSQRMRWSQCVEWTNKKMSMAVGALFIRDNFNQESKDTALEMIHTIRDAFNELLAENYWMDDETRAVAKEKADSMNERVGFPEMLKNPVELEKEFKNLTITSDNFLENIFNLKKWEFEKSVQLLRMPVDKEKWTTESAIVNAFYNPNRNDIVFPAGILQPLFYSKNFPKSLNYGGIGVVIGHEITHGFDDRGRHYDKDGNMMEWWNKATIEAFSERKQCIIDQYSKYKIDEVGMYMNGQITQSENIADNGGLKQSFRAYKKWVERHGPELLLPGLNLTHDQLFFLNYAQIWCGSNRPEDALSKIRASLHSPGFVRVLAPLSNSKDFSDTYKCQLGSQMNPVEKCSVW